jgi:hypothetical protein
MHAMADPDDDLLKKFFGSHNEQLLVQHVLREIDRGRDLADILDDPYITNRASELERRALLDHPEISRAVGDEVTAELKRSL